jgi:hypothetical protein
MRRLAGNRRRLSGTTFGDAEKSGLRQEITLNFPYGFDFRDERQNNATSAKAIPAKFGILSRACKAQR